MEKFLVFTVNFIALSLIFALLLALPVMWLWNSLMPEIFGLVQINFWQTLSLCVLLRGLFGTSYSGSSK